MKGRQIMEKEEHHERAVLVYLLALITFVILRMLTEVTILDVIYLITLICAVIRYFMIVREIRK